MCSSQLQSEIVDLSVRPDQPLCVGTSCRALLIGSVYERRLASALVIKSQLVLVAVDGYGAGFWTWQQMADSMPACRAAGMSGSGGPVRHVAHTHSSSRASSMPRTSMLSDAARDLVRACTGTRPEHAQTGL